MLYKDRGWICLLLILAGFYLATIQGSLLGREKTALIQSFDPKVTGGH